jgi:hypothetical protein
LRCQRMHRYWSAQQLLRLAAPTAQLVLNQ